MSNDRKTEVIHVSPGAIDVDDPHEGGIVAGHHLTLDDTILRPIVYTIGAEDGTGEEVA